MPDFVTREEFDQVRQQLQSDPGARGFTAFRGVPQVLHRQWNQSAFSGAYLDWQRAFTFNGKGNQLYPDRILDVQLVAALEIAEAVTVYGYYSLRWTVNDEVAVESLQGPLPGNGRRFIPIRLRVYALGSNYDQLYVLEHDTGVATLFVAANEQYDLANPWELGLDIGWAEAAGPEDPKNLDAATFTTQTALVTLY